MPKPAHRRCQKRSLTTAAVRASVVCGLACLALAWAAATVADTDTDRELVEVRQRLETLRAGMARDAGRKDKETRRLRETELAAARVAGTLKQLDTDLADAGKRLASLTAQRRERSGQLAAERETLAGLVRTAYINGRQEQLKMLLNQQDPAALGRLMTYYGYFNGQRVARIERVAAHLAEIDTLAARVETETRNLAELKTRRAAELKSLEAARTERKAVLATVDARLRDQGAQIARLEAQEQSLIVLIEELKRRLAEFPVASDQPFADLKGKLAWPVKGRLLGDFGQPRAGQRVKWNGVLVGADRGTPVLAVAHGRVAYSDWLPGLGLLVVLDHGDGYLSLYGHNATVTRSAGEWVDAGDAVATVGDTGGQARPALYFELRQQRTPVNPHRWFK